MTLTNTDAATFEAKDGFAALTITGAMSDDALKSLQETITQADEGADIQNVLIDISDKEFEGLSELSAAYEKVRRLLRFTPALEKVALVTDSTFLRNSAKMADATTPGLELTAFANKEMDFATAWLSGASMSEAVQNKAAEETAANSEDAEGDNPWSSLNLNKVSA